MSRGHGETHSLFFRRARSEPTEEVFEHLIWGQASAFNVRMPRRVECIHDLKQRRIISEWKEEHEGSGCIRSNQ